MLSDKLRFDDDNEPECAWLSWCVFSSNNLVLTGDTFGDLILSSVDFIVSALFFNIWANEDPSCVSPLCCVIFC